MKSPKLIITAVALLFVLSLAADTFADISSAAVLFLRIAPGSRAAGMGEAYVAVAEDATATHWNPAGLGNYPLSDTWLESDIPARYRPIKAFAPLSTGGTRNYQDYDIWAISPAGLIRYDNKNWSTGEVFSTRTDETVVQKTRNYFNVTDDARLAKMVEKVAAVNNRGSYQDLESLREQVLASLPDSYDRKEQVSGDLDSLLAAYNQCRVNWDRVDEARDRLRDGLKDSVMTGTESDRVAVALERSRNRFLPEDLIIPYGALFVGDLTSIISTGNILLVGSTDGLARYNGRNWAYLTTADGLPSNKVTALHAIGQSVLIGTDSGMAVFSISAMKPLTTPESRLPAGEIQAIGGGFMTDLYAVVDGDLYHYDGRAWANNMPYSVAIGDSLPSLAAKFSLYDSKADRERFVDKLKQVYEHLATRAEASSSADSTAVAAPDSTAVGVVEPSEGVADTVGGVTDEDVTVTTSGESGEVVIPGIDEPLSPGEIIRVPYLASLKGRVNDIYVDFKQRIWLGTEYGVFYFDSQAWQAPGYRTVEVQEGQTVDSLVKERYGRVDSTTAAYGRELELLNDLDNSGTLTVGANVRVYANPAAKTVNKMAAQSNGLLFATDDGLIEYDNYEWARTELHGLTREKIVGIATLQQEAWIASTKTLVVKGRGHSEVDAMYVKWLPELADDLYYSFLSVVTSKEGWGTFGGNFTLISYGKFTRTGATSPVPIGEFESFDAAFTLSYGTSLFPRLKGGVSAKFIYSRLADQGAGEERGSGTASGFAIDLGMLYLLSPRMTFGAALTNLGPKMSYIDAAQSDDLPRNLAIGLAYRLLQSEYTSLLVTAEVNKLMVGLDDGIGTELKEAVFNGGGEFAYANLIAFRMGYIYDQEGDIKTMTVGFGLQPVSWGSFDLAYIPSQQDFSLANTFRWSLKVIF